MKGNVLIIDAATDDGSVAIARDGAIAAALEFGSRDASGARTEALAPAVERVIAQAGIGPGDLCAVVCGRGPGGFTSLRSAAALSKGICAAGNIPLYAVSSLAILSWSADLRAGRYVAAISAGRNEWFAAPFTVGGDGARVVGEEYLVGTDELRECARAANTALVGAALDIDTRARAASVAAHLPAVQETGYVDLDSWEPAYGRLAEAQVRWEATHGRKLAV
ncbi:MAG: tRNA (adenosine(37)-N6)-threonylcarbamoyltransferase complex dimerization subunit type 1 TsaB [Gemmatimonadota bacterium]|nr:tRNA (adenosine(37)-N6)-threonylcarbamoyltransferase complex dimerization subunit type 1 TsaB [Gemmatimonadota bacterium]